MKKNNLLTNINTYLIIALVIVVALSLYFTLSVPTIKKTQPLPPAELKAVQVTILGNDCTDCFNISIAADFLKQQPGLNVTQVKTLNMDESKKIATKYNLSRLQAIIITGDIANVTVPSFVQKEDALVFSASPPPYYDLTTNSMKGNVEITHLKDASCKVCFNSSIILEQMQQQLGMQISNQKMVDAKSSEGKKLITQYKIEKIPALILSNDALAYDLIKQAWPNVGTEETDGMLVLRQINPPFVNVSTGKIEGLVDLTYLVDSTCKECYNVSIFKELFTESFGMQFRNSTTVDVNSTKGKTLLRKYSIVLVPTVLLSKEAATYPAINELWQQVGTQENGTFVFRNVALIENALQQAIQFRNLSSGEIESSSSPPNISDAEITPPTVET